MSQDYNPYAPTNEVSEDPFTTAHVGQPPLATRGERFAGAFVDGILNLIAIFAVVAALAFIGINIQADETLTQSVASTVISGLLGFGVFLAIHGYLLATQGRTVGKLLVKTQIVDRETNQIQPFGPLLMKRYVWLWLVTMIPIFGGIVGLIDVLLIFRENRACLHDDVAGTKVIKTG